ncbi:MAG: hypothetical protein ACYC21_13435 [Eubacteriales bacterium]
MDDLSDLLGPQDKGKHLVDKLMVLLDRQTDHKLTPNLMLGFLGLFNVLSIMSVVHGSPETGFKEITGSTEGNSGAAGQQSLVDTLSGLLKNQGSGQPDLMGLLGGLAAKKKINPNLLLSLFSMLNSQAGASPQGQGNPPVEAAGGESTEVPEDEPEKKTSNEKQGPELRYDRKRGAGERG